MKRWVATVVLLPLLGCSMNPVSGRPEVVFVSERAEIEAGAQAAEEVEKEFGIVHDPGLTAFVDAVGQRVAVGAPVRGYPYRFAVLDDEIPNAFALPGGYVYVSRGLLAITNGEAELANVLAHEIAHVAARHHAERQARAVGIGILALPGMLVGGLIPGPMGDVVSAPFAIAGMGELARYSRDQEREADRIGQDLAADAGYDPTAMARFLVTMERWAEHMSHEERGIGFLSTHPSTPSRASDAARSATQVPWEPRPALTETRIAFLLELEGILLGPNPANGIFRGQRFLHPDLGFAVGFPEGWSVFNVRRAVGAVSPKNDAQVMLELSGRGIDLREAASNFLEEAEQHIDLDVARIEATRVNGLSALRAQALADTKRGRLPLDLTWVKLGNDVYLISGIVDGDYKDSHRRLFDGVAGSFRALTPEERASIHRSELGVRQIEAGETLEDFGRRTGNTWDPVETAIANGLAEGARPGPGQALKIAVEKPYP
jgi:predicted Zn-dependent protease